MVGSAGDGVAEAAGAASGDAGNAGPGDSGRCVVGRVDAGVVSGWVARLAGFDAGVTDAQRIDQIRVLEELKAAAAAAQARIAVALDASQRAAQAAAGVPARLRGRGVAGQVGLARRESAFRGAQHLGLAKVLVAEMPHTLAALQRGLVSEWRASLLARETACLSVEHRRLIDARLVADPAVLAGWGDRRLIAEIQRLACQLDTAAVVRRHARAASERRVTCRPAPDAMALVSALVPAAQGVAAYAALRREASTRIAGGDPRTRSQIMADTLVTRLTGQATAAAVPVEIHLVMTDRSLLSDHTPHNPHHPDHPEHPADPADPENPAGPEGPEDLGGYEDSDNRDDRDDRDDRDGDDRGGGAGGGDDGHGGDEPGGDEPGLLSGFGPIPAALARRLAVTAAEAEAAWLRRLYTAPGSGELIAMDSARRRFPPGLARFIQVRDQFCRTPWCDAPIRHIDHATPHGQHGATSADNGNGLCEQCNYNRQAPGWQARRRAGPRHTLQITTPTGHTYITTPPRPPGAPPRTRRRAPRQRAREQPRRTGGQSRPTPRRSLDPPGEDSS
jgi:Domain of unknown function (DUF222)